MTCPRCHAENREGRGSARECAAPLAPRVPACGRRMSPGEDFCGGCARPRSSAVPSRRAHGSRSAESYTPKHLAEKILTSKAALEGERKQVTVLFADLKGSMELLADRDPEEARKLLDPVLERMMEAVHRYEGTVNQVMGDGIMALFGAPLAHEDHAVRACYAALDMQEAIRRYAEEVRRTHGVDGLADPGRPQLGRGRGPRHRQRPPHGLHRGRPDHASGRAHGAARQARYHAADGRHAPARRGLRRGQAARAGAGEGPGRPDRGLRADGRGPAALPPAGGGRAGAHPLRGTRRASSSSSGRRSGRAAAGHGQVVAIVGEPGVGKSRLVWEFTHSHRTHGWLDPRKPARSPTARRPPTCR